MLIGDIQFSGLASGLDTRALIDAILQAERRPLERLQQQQRVLSARKTAYGELLGKLNAFEGALRDLSSPATFRGRTTSVSDESALRASAGSSAETGLFTVEVFHLAAAHKVKSDGLAASDEALVTDGAITIRSGENDPITIDVTASEGNNTLEAVRDAINAADAGVSASILFDGTDYRLIVRAEETGLDNALVITDGTNLNLGAPENIVQAAADASLEVDGIAVTSSSNRVTQVIEGVTLDLVAETAGTPVTLEISQDDDGIVEAVQDLVSSYNELVDYFNAQFDRDNPGALEGDSTARRIQSKVQSLVTGGVPGIPIGQIRSLSSVGVDFDGRTGRMSLDTAELREVLDTNFEEVGNFFLGTGSASDPRVRFLSASAATLSGEYDVTVTQAAERATLIGSTAIRAQGLAQDETLTITVNGESTDVQLLSGMGIAEVVTAVNGALEAAGLAASASDEGGALRITSDSYGSSQSITVVSDRNTNPSGNQSGFSTTQATDEGLDVLGTIGGVEATGIGQLLTAAADGDYAGLVVRVTATAADVTATGGDFGSVSYTRGLMKTLVASLEELTRLGDGPIDLATDNISANQKRLADDIERFERRLGLREAQLVRTFAEAERAISALQAQQSAFGAF